MKTDKPPLWRFLFVIRSEQSRTENTLVRIVNNDIFPTRPLKKYRVLDEKLHETYNLTLGRRFDFSKVMQKLTDLLMQ